MSNLCEYPSGHPKLLLLIYETVKKIVSSYHTGMLTWELNTIIPLKAFFFFFNPRVPFKCYFFFFHSLIPQITHYFILIFLLLHPWPPDNSSLGKIPTGVQDTVLLVVHYFLRHFVFSVSAPLYSLTEHILQRSVLWPLLIDLHVSSQNEFTFLFLFTTWIKAIGTEEWHVSPSFH